MDETNITRQYTRKDESLTPPLRKIRSDNHPPVYVWENADIVDDEDKASPIQIEEGKRYITRSGREVGPLVYKEGLPYPFVSAGHSWIREGLYLVSNPEHPLTIVSEAVTKQEEPQKIFQLEEGKYYRSREGGVLGPVFRRITDSEFTFGTSNENGSIRAWTAEGSYTGAYDNPEDLIEECEPPLLVKVAELIKAPAISDSLKDLRAQLWETWAPLIGTMRDVQKEYPFIGILQATEENPYLSIYADNYYGKRQAFYRTIESLAGGFGLMKITGDGWTCQVRPTVEDLIVKELPAVLADIIKQHQYNS